jgi:thymine-DNA glycosylase
MKMNNKLDPSKFKELPDYIKPHLDILFCGINPGAKSALDGHHYAHPTNHFWPCLNASGIIPTSSAHCQPLTHLDDYRCTDLFNIGFTNLCGRPTRVSSHLTGKEYQVGALILMEKLERYRPRIVCFEGREICRQFVKFAMMSADATIKLTNVRDGGKFDDGMIGRMIHGDDSQTLLFQMPSSSARCTVKKEYKLKLFQDLAKLMSQ